MRISFADLNWPSAWLSLSTQDATTLKKTRGIYTMTRSVRIGALLTVAMAAALSTPAAAQSSAPDADERGASETEIVVTAEKQSARLIDTPVPVAVLDAGNLTENSQNRLSDYANQVPGLSFNKLNRGESLLAIRGVTTCEAAAPTVGIVIDDIPFGASTGGGFGFAIPEIDPGTLSSVEVLRGPQGTLYGASAMGGLIKFTTQSPSTDEFSGQVRAGVETVSHSKSLGYSVGGMLNIPLSDTFAVQGSAFTRFDPGYIDNPRIQERDVNEQDALGGRIAAFWQPSERFSLKLSAIYQRNRLDAAHTAEIKPGLGELEQDAMPGAGYLNTSTQFYSAVAKASFGAVDMTSLTGYTVNKLSDSIDRPTLAEAFGLPGAAIVEEVRTKKFSQELRFDVPLGDIVDLLVGGFYTNEKTKFAQDISANDADGAFTGFIYESDNPYRFEEYALFGNLTFHLSNRFDVQVGARQSENKQTFSQHQEGLLVGGVIDLPEGTIKDSSFTYLFTPSYKIADDVLLYARLASGYRAGGPNTVITSGVYAPPFGPDKTKTYEIGTKGRLFDGVFDFDASLFHIDWEDVQIVQVVNGSTLATNGGAARSRGAELTVGLHPVDGMTIGGWVVYNEAELAEDFPLDSDAFGLKGDPLPYSSRWSGNVTFDHRFDLSGGIEASFGATMAIVGKRTGLFTAIADRQTYPSYTQFNLRAGLSKGDLSLNLFANNVTDKRGLQSGGIGTGTPTGFQFIQPRTIGLQANYRF